MDRSYLPIVIIFQFCILFLPGCSNTGNNDNESSRYTFSDYWNNEKSEITSYKLHLTHDQQTKSGHAVLIYSGKGSQGNSREIMYKQIMNFKAGISSCSMLLTTITPVNTKERKPVSEIVSSVQDWDQLTFVRLNKDNDGYEGFIDFGMKKIQHVNYEQAFTEDEIWTLIRVNPELLPTGKFKMIPGAFLMQETKQINQVYQVEARLNELWRDKGVLKYTITYQKPDRTLSIKFSKTFPHAILSWEEKQNGRAISAVKMKILKGASNNSFLSKNK